MSSSTISNINNKILFVNNFITNNTNILTNKYSKYNLILKIRDTITSILNSLLGLKNVLENTTIYNDVLPLLESNFTNLSILLDSFITKLQNIISTLPVDCVISNQLWSDWSLCSALCGEGTQYRYRLPEVLPNNGGVTCPPITERQETRSCNLGSCNDFTEGVVVLRMKDILT